MANSPDNDGITNEVILDHLRGLRTVLDQHSKAFEAIDQRFDQVDARLDHLSMQVKNISKTVDETEIRSYENETKIKRIADHVGLAL